MFLKRIMSGSAGMFMGQLFQTTGPAYVNACSQSLVRTLGT